MDINPDRDVNRRNAIVMNYDYTNLGLSHTREDVTQSNKIVLQRGDGNCFDLQLGTLTNFSVNPP